MTYSEKYYKELLILKRTKDFLLEELYEKSRTYPDEYNYVELKEKLNRMNTLFELNRFVQLIAQEKKEKDLLYRQLNRIQQGALSTFCTYIVEEPIGFSYASDIDPEGEYYATSDDESDIPSRDALDEIINELREFEEHQRVFILKKILKEHIYNIAYILSFHEEDYDNYTRAMADIGTKMPAELLKYRMCQYNRFITDLIKEMYLWFKIDVIELLTKEKYDNLSLILNIGNMTVDKFNSIREAILKRQEGIINSEELENAINETIKTPRIAKIKEELSLTQEQIIIIFRSLRDQNAINPHTTDTMLGDCISRLTGYKSRESIRQRLNLESYSDIISKTKNREAVITIFEKIINQLSPSSTK